MNINDFAEQLLMGNSLDDKLISPDKLVYNDYSAIKAAPTAPGRPELLSFKASESVPFPKQFDDDHARGQVMHFFANHELLAIEIMALALLRFPEAPKAFKVGLVKTIREEQEHMNLYRERMKDLGVEFGSIPVNDYFWKAMKDMNTPMDYVMSLSLIFEQANLDFSKHFLNSFKKLGDTKSADVLQTVYDDEISHVQFGLHWFRKWKQRDKSDWQTFCEKLNFPLSPARAKSSLHFDFSARKKAGFDDEFISELEVYSQSKGRPPKVYYFNPSSENYLAAGLSHSPNQQIQDLQNDLQNMLFLMAGKDDIVLTHRKPNREHLKSLRDQGFELPEFVEIDPKKKLIPRKTIVHRHIDKFIPWGYSPEIHKRFATFKEHFQKHDVKLYSKVSTRELRQHLNCSELGDICSSFDQVMQSIQTRNDFPILIKACLGASGQNQIRIDSQDLTTHQSNQLRGLFKTQKEVIVEKYHQRFADFSALYEKQGDKVIFKGITRLLVDSRGQFLGNLVNYHRWNLSSEEMRFLHQDCNFANYYKGLVTELKVFFKNKNFEGAFGIDFYFHKDDKELKWQKICELNPRITMGRLAIELGRKLKTQSPYACLQLKKSSKLFDSNCYDSSHKFVYSDMKQLNDVKNSQGSVYLFCKDISRINAILE